MEISDLLEDSLRTPEAGLEENVAPPRNLRRILVATDLAAVLLAWGVTQVMPLVVEGHSASRVVTLGVLSLLGAIATYVLVAWQGLHQSHVCSLKTVELQRLAQACVGGSLVTVSLITLRELPFNRPSIGLTAIASLALLSLGRSVFRSWLSSQRSKDRYVRRVVLIGSNDDAQSLAEIVTDHPELGLRVVGYTGGEARADAVGAPWLGAHGRALSAVRRAQATGAILIASDIDTEGLNDVTRELLSAGVHVQLANGLRGIGHQRLRPTPLAHEPLLYVRPAELTPWQLRAKRLMDVTIAVAMLLFTLPILGAAALAIWATDRGPVFYTQERVGRHGTPFKLFKLRTMVQNAELRVADLAAENQRSGPLFKLASDPRVTRVGRLLRASSIDELPQLLNVLGGSMSLVGPRPALPSEAAQFDAKLRTRTDVPPGITGLWQLEGRDKPSFSVYRRLDLFYVENWSIAFDLSLILSTAVAVASRGVCVFLGPLRRGESQGATVLD